MNTQIFENISELKCQLLPDRMTLFRSQARGDARPDWDLLLLPNKGKNNKKVGEILNN